MNDEDIRSGLSRLARETRPDKPLPNAEQIWWRAEVIRRLVAREEAVRHAERPLFWSQAAGLILVLVGLLAFLLAQEPRLLVALFALGLTPLVALLALLVLRHET